MQRRRAVRVAALRISTGLFLAVAAPGFGLAQSLPPTRAPAY
jgi:hypothetical protein